MRPELPDRSDRAHQEAELLRFVVRAAKCVSIVVPAIFAVLWVGALAVRPDAIALVYLFVVALWPPALAFGVASLSGWLGRAAADSGPPTARCLRRTGILLAHLALLVVALEALGLGIILFAAI